MEIEELVEKVKDNDDTAYKEILTEHHKMIHYIINEFTLEFGDYKISREDLYQEASIALYDACIAYKKGKDAKFSTFAYMVIKRRLIRNYQTDRERYLRECVSIDAFECFDHYKGLSTQIISENPVEYHETKEFFEKIKQPLLRISDEDKRIILLRMENFSYQEIANIMNITTKRIDNRLSRLRRQYLKK